jgi:hypothetical protein
MTTNSYYTARATEVFSGRNRIINGDCRVAQRGSLTITTSGSGYGGPDRMFCAINGGGGTFTQSQGTLSYNGITLSTVTQTVGTVPTSLTGSNCWNGFDHRIEGYNSYDLVGLPVMLSFIFASNVSGSYSVSLQDYTATHSYVTTFSYTAGSAAYVTVPIPTLPTSLSVPNSSAGGLILRIGALNQATLQCPTGSLGAWQASNYISAQGATNWATTASNYISVTNLQLEVGNVATPFEREAYGVTLQKCQRYYQTVAFSVYGYQLAGGTAMWPIPLPMPMRSVPTLTLTTTPTTSNVSTYTIAADGQQLINFWFNVTASGTGYCSGTVYSAAAEL